jgi:FKBP-type peptidyl-prolyl cis-trans isomerase FklB
MTLRFANSPHQCETKFMIKQPKTLFTICAIGFLSAAATLSAQQTPSTSAAGSSSGSSAAKTTKPAGTTSATHHTTAAAPLILKTDRDKASYAIGQGMAKNLERNGLTSADVNTTIIARAIRDALSGAKPAMTEEEQNAALTALSTTARTKMEAKNQVIGDENKKAGDAFLAANKTKDGVVTLPSGLQYKVITQGTGPKPSASDTVSCNYRGTTIDGKEFDASAKHGGPISFQVNGVIKGWTEALQLMPVGSKYQLFIPSDLAYGARGAGGDIPPNSTLIFDVELVSIKGK